MGARAWAAPLLKLSRLQATTSRCFRANPNGSRESSAITGRLHDVRALAEPTDVADAQAVETAAARVKR